MVRKFGKVFRNKNGKLVRYMYEDGKKILTLWYRLEQAKDLGRELPVVQDMLEEGVF